MSLAANGTYLVDTRATTLDPINDVVFTVTNNAVRLEAFGLIGSDTAAVQILVGPDTGETLWTNLYLNGQQVKLSATNNQVLMMLGGKYRVHYTGDADVVVYLEQDLLSLDKNVFYNYQQPVSSSGGSGGGFELTVENTEAIQLTYTGDSSAGTLEADAVASATSDNVLTVSPDGLYVPDQAFHMPWSAESADFSITTTENHAYSVTAASESFVTGDLPDPTLVTDKVYMVLALGLGTVQLSINGGLGTLNGVSGDIVIPSGSAMWLFSNGVDDWIGVLGASVV